MLAGLLGSKEPAPAAIKIFFVINLVDSFVSISQNLLSS